MHFTKHTLGMSDTEGFTGEKSGMLFAIKYFLYNINVGLHFLGVFWGQKKYLC